MFSCSLQAASEPYTYAQHIVHLLSQEEAVTADPAWPVWRDDMLKDAATSPTVSHIHKIVQEKASQLSTPIDLQPENLQKKAKYRPVVRVLDDVVGYLYLPSLAGYHQLDPRFERDLRNLILRMNRRVIQGWIVDVRDCQGEGAAALLPGLVGLLGSGTVAYVKSAQHQRPLVLGTLQSVYEGPIALLQGTQTSGMGEGVLIACMGRANVRRFGELTQGRSYIWKTHVLPDGARLLIGQEKMADRQGREVSGPIMPDERVPEEKQRDAVLEAALKWLIPEIPPVVKETVAQDANVPTYNKDAEDAFIREMEQEMMREAGR